MSFLKKVKIFPALGILALALTGLTACNEKHEHTFSEEWEYSETLHWHEATCDHVDERKDIEAHVFDNNCDPDCNVCGYTRTPSDHVYDHACDTTCNECGHEREVEDHHYCSDCDTTCNHCGHTREVGEHVYDHACDDQCNECGHKRTVAEHNWSEDYKNNGEGEHWHYCTHCDIRGPREACVYDQKVSEDKYLHTAATNTTKGVYYYSCVCGEASDTLTYELEKLASGIGYFNRSKNYDGLPAEIDCRVKSDGELIAEFKKIGESEDKYTTVVPKDAAVYDVRVTVKETPIYRGATVSGFYTINPLNIEIDLSDYDLVVTQDSNEPAIVTLDDTVTGILPGETADVSVLPADDSVIGAQDLTIDTIESLNTNYVVTATSDTAKFIVRSAGATYFTVSSAFLDTGSNNFRIHGNVTGGDLVIGDKLELPGLDLVVEVETLRRSGNADAGGIVQSGNGANVILNAATMDADYLALLEDKIRAGMVFTVNNDIEFQDTYLANFYFKTTDEGGRTAPIAWEGYKPNYKLNDFTNRYAIIKAAYGTDNDNGLIFPGETVTLLIQFVNNYTDLTPMKTIIKPGINVIEMAEPLDSGFKTTAVGTISYNTDELETSFVQVGFGLVSDSVTGDGFTYLVDLTDKEAVDSFRFYSTENGLNNDSTLLSYIASKFSVIIYEITDTGLIEVPGVLQDDGGFIKEGETADFLFENGRQFVIHIELLQDISAFCFGMV